MNIKQAIEFGVSVILESDTATLDTQLILLHSLNAHRNILFTDPQMPLTDTQQAAFKQLLARRVKGEPVAYIIGQQGFWDLDLKVSPDTLIPRPDTESLIDWVLEKNLQPKRILDLGTGTGAIALALAKEFPSASVVAVDLVDNAVALGQENAQHNNINNVIFKQSNWFSGLSKGQDKFDLIVSNPPYIDSKDEHLSQGDVRFEPLSALVADEHGLSDIKIIAQHSSDFLLPGGCLLMEHGWQQASPVQEILKQHGYHNVGSGKDLGQRERFSYGFL